ncbi:MAG: phenylalanine--tRNA ligase subunit alpha [Prevotellaceae bacterium]|jgi:phenylalanyl-tRNA synthetase alpha chain|nr:phenylalanine--tRNA ligase subunit alpha [Prevotellaceae bacterium]
MNERIEKIKKELENIKIESLQQLEEFRVRITGKKGELTQLFENFKTVIPEKKKELGKELNLLKNAVINTINELREKFENQETDRNTIDLSLPSKQDDIGSRHPISIAKNEILDIFKRLGFTVANGPEIENDWHVFSALNFPPEHPARDMQDTFFIAKNANNEHNNILLRTHTSSVQVRVMENQKPPIRVVCPGRVFRNEAISARAHCIFHQVEGLYIDENVSFADMKQTLLYFSHEMFGKNTKIRLRPSFFPFTEPSAEMDVSCTICGGKGCNICKHTGWLEIMGCGMVDPNVLESCGINNKKYTGYAFGMGIERMAMLKWQVKDLRLYFENDIRFLKQFESVT